MNSHPESMEASIHFSVQGLADTMNRDVKVYSGRDSESPNGRLFLEGLNAIYPSCIVARLQRLLQANCEPMICMIGTDDLS